MNILFWKFVNIFLLLQRTIAVKKIWETTFWNFILGPQNGQNGFWPGQMKTNFCLSFSSFLNKLRNTFCFVLKMLNNNFCEFFDLGSHNSLQYYNMCPKMCSKITPPYHPYTGTFFVECKRLWQKCSKSLDFFAHAKIFLRQLFSI